MKYKRQEATGEERWCPWLGSHLLLILVRAEGVEPSWAV
jgi:hypothetical protein